MENKDFINLIPSRKNPSPDYYCTWQTQLYATSGGTPAEQRRIINEHYIFNTDFPCGWAYFYEKARDDLYFVMDDSWDVPETDYQKYYGCLFPDSGKFPEATRGNDSTEALASLTERIKSIGWKGLGGWVCAQESEIFKTGSTEDYWISRLKAAQKAGFSYWKVDWGKKASDAEFRKALSRLARIYAPELTLENAMLEEVIPYSDAFRTYDVPALMSIPMTMEKIQFYAGAVRERGDFKSLLNCEDEAYIAAAGGFTMGIMRHPFTGAFPDGRPDRSFPEIHRNIKSKLTEVTRAVRWHRIAPAYALDGNEFLFAGSELQDSWKFENIKDEIEQWWLSAGTVKDFISDGVLTKSAVSGIARRCSLPSVIPDRNGDIPFTVSSLNPGGAYSIVTAGRTRAREYFTPLCDITADAEASTVFGVFGYYGSLTLLSSGIKKGMRVLAQDLADDRAADITGLVSIKNGSLTVPGRLISEIGRTAQPAEDTSEPGIVITVKP